MSNPLPKVYMPPQSDDSPDLKSLIAKIRENGDFEGDKLLYDKVTLTDDDMVELADALRGNTRLKGITLRRMEQVTDKGSIALAEALEGNPRVEIIGLSNNAMTDASAAAWAKTLSNSRTLHDVNFAKNDMTAEGQEQLFTAVIKSENPNLLSLWTFLTNPPEVKRMIDGNRREAWNLAEEIIAHPNRLSGDDLRSLDTRIPTVMEQARMQATSLKVDASPETYTPAYGESLLAALPKLPPAGESFAEALFTADAQGYAPLDNPRLWESPEAARQTLDSLPLNKDFLTRPTLRGSSILDAAAHALPAKEFVRYFNAKGISISQDFLLDGSGKPTQLFARAIRDHKAPAFFTPSNWEASNTEGIRKAFAHLPDAQQSRVGITRLLHEVKRAAPQYQGIGR